jgi:hypothetical protein
MSKSPIYNYIPAWFTQRTVEIYKPMPPYGSPKVVRTQVVPEDTPDFACHYCLEPLPLIQFESADEYRVCPICRHRVLDAFLQTPVHLLTRAQQVEMFMGELNFIKHLRFILDLSLERFEHASYENENEKADFKEAWDFIVSQKEVVLAMDGPVEVDFCMVFLDYKKPKSNLKVYLYQPRSFWFDAHVLSRSGNDPIRVNGFQLGLVKATNWAAYGYPHCEQMAVIGILKCRRQLAWDEVYGKKA